MKSVLPSLKNLTCLLAKDPVQELRQVWKEREERQKRFPDHFISVRQAAFLAGMSADVIRRKIRRGEIRAYGKAGRFYRVMLSDVLPEVQFPKSLARSKEEV